MTSVVVLFEYLDKGVTEILPNKYIIILTDLSNAIKKMLDKISFHKHFKHFWYFKIQEAFYVQRSAISLSHKLLKTMCDILMCRMYQKSLQLVNLLK